MTIPAASFATYLRLRDMDLAHPDPAHPDPAHPDTAHPDTAKRWTLGQTASWARWGDRTDDVDPVTARTKRQYASLQPLTTSVVLFAINWGGWEPPADARNWQNFHAEHHSGDSTLKNSIRLAMDQVDYPDGVIPAPYMTDVFKLVPTPTSRELKATIKADLKRDIDHVARCAAILEDELRVCLLGASNKTPIILAMGDMAYDWLRGSEPDTHRGGRGSGFGNRGAQKRTQDGSLHLR